MIQDADEMLKACPRVQQRKQWEVLNSGCVLKVEPTAFPDNIDAICMREREKSRWLKSLLPEHLEDQICHWLTYYPWPEVGAKPAQTKHLIAPGTAAPSSLRFRCPWFQSHAINSSPKMLNEKFQKKEFRNFKLCPILNSRIKSHASRPLHLAWNGNHPFVQHLPSVSPLAAIAVIRLSAVVSQCLCSSYPDCSS